MIVDTSADQAALELASDYGCEHLNASRNAGYAWALNHAFDTFPNDVLIASNPDVVYSDGCVARLVELASQKRAVFYPVQLEFPSGPTASYNALNDFSPTESLSRWTGIRRGHFERIRRSFIDHLDNSGKSPIEFPLGLGGSGAMFAMNLATWNEVGGMDSSYFLYEEDRSLSASLRDSRIPALIVPDARIVHEGGVRNNGLTLFTLQEALTSERIFWSEAGFRPASGIFVLQIVGVLLRCLRTIFQRDFIATRKYWDLARFVLSSGTRPDGPRGRDGLRTPAGGSAATRQ